MGLFLKLVLQTAGGPTQSRRSPVWQDEGGELGHCALFKTFRLVKCVNLSRYTHREPLKLGSTDCNFTYWTKLLPDFVSQAFSPLPGPPQREGGFELMKTCANEKADLHSSLRDTQIRFPYIYYIGRLYHPKARALSLRHAEVA